MKKIILHLLILFVLIPCGWAQEGDAPALEPQVRLRTKILPPDKSSTSAIIFNFSSTFADCPTGRVYFDAGGLFTVCKDNEKDYGSPDMRYDEGTRTVSLADLSANVGIGTTTPVVKLQVSAQDLAILFQGKYNPSEQGSMTYAGYPSFFWDAPRASLKVGSFSSNTVPGSYSLGIGSETHATSDYAIAAGTANGASAQSAAVMGGENNTATALNATVLGGDTNSAQADNSIIVGGQNNAILNVAKNAGILAGSDNQVVDNPPYVFGQTMNSVVLGGERNAIQDSTNAFLIGDGGVTLDNSSHSFLIGFFAAGELAVSGLTDKGSLSSEFVAINKTEDIENALEVNGEIRFQEEEFPLGSKGLTRVYWGRATPSGSTLTITNATDLFTGQKIETGHYLVHKVASVIPDHCLLEAPAVIITPEGSGAAVTAITETTTIDAFHVKLYNALGAPVDDSFNFQLAGITSRELCGAAPGAGAFGGGH
ncbi:MAG: hypothetical protein Q7S13_04710 [Candidatus Omnitrophota bacterium]|nr:hypothetical protein [Candidatus Omnitrophota bacterium]